MQTLDPRLGNQRRKSMIAKVAQKAMAKKGYTSKVGTFGKLANAGEQARGLKPNRGPGQRTNMARPGGYQDFLDGLSGGPGGSGSGVTPGSVNTAPTHAGLPDSYVNTMQNTLPPDAPAGAPAAPTAPFDPNQTYQTTDPTQGYTATGGTSTDPAVSSAYNYGINYGNSPEAQSAVLGFDTSQFQPLQQSTPSSPITAPGGFIPLGGGRYYDPATDRIMGAGTGGRAV